VTGRPPQYEKLVYICIFQAPKLYSPRQTVKKCLGAFISANNPTPLRDAFLPQKPRFRFLKTHITSKEEGEGEGEEKEWNRFSYPFLLLVPAFE
jgi:hypothetical protein